MEIKRICKRLLLHGTATVLAMSTMLGAFDALGVTNSKTSTGIVASAEEEEAPKEGKGQFRSGGHTYTYEYSTSITGVETFTLTSIVVGNRNVSIPSQIYIDRKLRTVNRLGWGFGMNISAETVTIPDTVTSISDYVLYNCKVGRLYVSSNVKTIGEGFCSNSPNLGNVIYYGTKLESLGRYSFSERNTDNNKVYGVKKNSKGAYIFGDWLIKYVGGNSSVNISDIGNNKIKKLAPYCFGTGNKVLNNNLKRVILSGVTTIGEGAFSLNPNLYSVSSHSSIATVEGTDAFKNTKWYEDQKKKNICILGSVLMYYHTDGKIIDLSGYDYRNVKTVHDKAISNCNNATTLKIRSTLEKFKPASFADTRAGVTKIAAVYVDGKNIVYDDLTQFIPKSISESLDPFNDSPFVNKFIEDKIKGIFRILGITYYGKSGKGGVSKISNSQKFQIACKLHDYIITNYYYTVDRNPCHPFKPFLDGTSGFACQEYAFLYAYLLESAGINAEVVDSVINDSKGNYIYNGNHAWTIVEIGGKWYHCDTSSDRSRRNYNLDSMYWFMVSDDFIRLDVLHGKWELADFDTIKSAFFTTQKYLPKCTSFLGDANGDGKRSQDDADLIQKYLLKDQNAIKKIKLPNCDTNFSGKVEMSDVITAQTLANHKAVDQVGNYLARIRANHQCHI